jgi:GT2 family glycosyltransferase
MILSILIIHYKTLKLTTDCIRSIEAHTKGIDYEVIVIDNDSQDGAKDLILSNFPSVRWLDMGYNAGFARANNAGMRVAKGEFVALLNSDTLLLDDIFTRLVQHLHNEPDVVACGGIQLDKNQQAGYLYRSLKPLIRTCVILPPSHFFDNLLVKIFPEKHFADPQQVEWIPAALLMVRQTAIEKAGMLDEDFFMYGEDAEWNCRLGRVGKLKVYNDCRYIHYEWGSDSGRKKQETTPINRFYPQIQLSNLVWIRKEYGLMPYLLLMFNYYVMLVFYFVWKMIVNIKNGKSPFSELDHQRDYARKLGTFASYFWKIVWNKPYFYKLPRP